LIFDYLVNHTNDIKRFCEAGLTLAFFVEWRCHPQFEDRGFIKASFSA
jgi:hypothetical protein